MFKLIFAKLFEQLANSVLSLDATTPSWLERNQGKVIRLNFLDLNQSMYLIIQANQIFIFTVYNEKPDAIISGTSLTFFRQLIVSVPGQGLEIEGDIELAQALQQLIHHFNFEWEELMANLLGDIATSQLVRQINKLKNTSNEFKQRGVEDLREFIQEEQRFLPPREEVEDFYEEIAILRQDIERLEAKLSRLKEN